MERLRVDAVVLGAGTAGANTAWQLADRGLAVVLLERRPAGAAGATWHNGVLDRHFRQAGLPPPTGAERHGSGGVVHLVGPAGGPRVTVADSPVVRADMSLLGERLRNQAAEAGVRTFDRVGPPEVELRGERVVAVVVDTLGSGGGRPGPATGRIRLEAPLFVDASGRRSVLGRSSPVLRRWCPPVRADELCSAADHVFRVADPDGARRFCGRFDASPGETVTQVGTHGGFSTRSVTVASDLSTVSVLVGCLANGRHGTGPRMMAELRGEQSWIGSQVGGGAGVIPLRRVRARTTAPGVAMVGDAACQVFPGHGSGIGLGLVAGRLLAEAVSGASDPGDPATLWGYQSAWHREFGELVVSYDAVRRMSTALGSQGVQAMFAAGLMSARMARAGLDQAWDRPPPTELAAMGARLARHPRLAATALPLLARGQLAARAAAYHPPQPDEAALLRWDRRVARLLGPLPR